MDIYSTAEIAKLEGCGESTARRWAQGNGLKKIGKDFVWTNADRKRFQKRDKPGRRWPKGKNDGNKKKG
jgi:hypothetical protein